MLLDTDRYSANYRADSLQRRLYRIASAVGLSCLVAGCSTGGGPEDRPDRLAPGELIEPGANGVPPGVTLRTVFPLGVDTTKQSEGWVAHLYDDAAGYCTIGYGHLIKKARCDGTEPSQFRAGLTLPQGESILVGDMAGAQYTVMTAVVVPMTDGQFASLVDFVFNVGSTNFRGSTLLSTVNARELDRVEGQFNRWVMANGKPWPGLATRRQREVTLFFTGITKPRVIPRLGERLTPIDVRAGEQR
jgi:lysozyme